MSKLLPLVGKNSNGRFTIVDDRDYEELSAIRLIALTNGRGVTCVAVCKGTKYVLLHRILTGALPGQQVDHINRKPLDNRRCNLRLATPEQNAWNQSSRGGASPYKGVCNVRGTRWRARITIQGGRVHLGYFTNEIDAAKAYDEAARIAYGEFACLNFVE